MNTKDASQIEQANPRNVPSHQNSPTHSSSTLVLSERFCEAFSYAFHLHALQRRKLSQSPYLGHLLRVAGLVIEWGADEEEAIAALLHDAIEDHGPQRRSEILERFGVRVLEIVEGCTDTDQKPKPPWPQRKQAHLARLRGASPSVRLVVAADKLDNLRCLLASYRLHGETVWEKFSGKKAGTLWYYRAVTEVLQAQDDHPLIGELRRAIEELQQLCGLNP